ncbi:uncharacterized protein EDB91DRAFT_1078313 [Suillus paluster]|uniref:uncharacterized protein n=1 Tax=Suillus paluster TaxID=48578 RepID=UPI001B8656FB|nr:uncharacterized protein EDB91DRAFT_1078313 [Suillus paluster]KAG1751554.1 hypothetical protein EDB91DRAFT_1078313 [Suillus paluster]
MTLHLHISKSALGEMGTSDGQTNKIENTKRAITTNGSPEANARVPHIDPQIHTADIVQFTQFGFEEKVERLANCSGFQPSMIQDVYKHSSTFKQAENIAKAMRVTAVKCVVSKINRQVMLNGDGEDGDDKEDEEEEEEEEEEKKENNEGKNEKKNKDEDVKDEDKSCKEDRMMLVSSARVVKLSASGYVRVALMQCEWMHEVCVSSDKEDRMMLVSAQSSPPELVVDNGPKEDIMMLVSSTRIV